MLSLTSTGLIHQFERHMQTLETEVEDLKKELEVMRARERHITRSLETDRSIGEQAKAGTLPPKFMEPVSQERLGVLAHNMLFDLDNKRILQHKSITTKYLKPEPKEK